MFRAPCFLEALRIKRRLLGIEFMAVILVHPLDDTQYNSHLDDWRSMCVGHSINNSKLALFHL